VELRSRALLIANLAKGTHFKNMAVQNQNPDDPQVKNDLEASANVTVFVKLVDLAQGIAEVLLQLKQLGHLLYQKQVSSVNLGLVGVRRFLLILYINIWLVTFVQEGINSLQKLYKELHDKLKEWEDILNRARRQHYLLTYLNASQLLLLRSFLDNSLEDQMKTHLRNALAFFHPLGYEVNLGENTPSREEDLFKRVCEVGAYLDRVSCFPLCYLALLAFIIS
jgi:hypothetical protein